MAIKSVAGLVGMTILAVRNEDNYDLVFEFDEGVARLYHEQDCCESVTIEDINGDLNDLVGTPLLADEERISHDEPGLSTMDESNTWTFYTFRTIKGSVDVRWHGSSNGYYSEWVNFVWYAKK